MAHQISWNKSYELGVEEIDDQHHYFIVLINRLATDLEHIEEDDHAFPAAVIAELNAYARFHFISEENLMARYGYPDLETHNLHHMELLNQLSNKEVMLQVNKSGGEARKIIDFLVEWFFNHTTKEDRRAAEYIKSKRPRSVED